MTAITTNKMSRVDLNDDRGPSINRSIFAIIINRVGRAFDRKEIGVSLGSSDYILIVGWLMALPLAAMSFAGKLLFSNKLSVHY